MTEKISRGSNFQPTALVAILASRIPANGATCWPALQWKPFQRCDRISVLSVVHTHAKERYMECTTLTPSRQCAGCGAQFQSFSKKRQYCTTCIMAKGRRVTVRPCARCGHDIEIVVSCKEKLHRDSVFLCCSCRFEESSAMVPHELLCVGCGCKLERTGTRGPIPTHCKRCRNGTKKTRLCDRCGKPCTHNARFCADCFDNHGRKRLASKACSVCGEMFQPKTNSRLYCNRPDCRSIGRKRTLDAKYGRKNDYVCLHCGEKYKPKKAEYDTFCTRDCCFAWRESNPKLGPEPVPDAMPPCEICGYPVINRNAKTCHREACKRARYLRQVIANSDRDYSPRPCKECGEVFTPEYGDKRQAYCSPICSDKRNGRIGKAIRRARLRGAKIESVDPFAVFRRDGWHCKLCGGLTPKRLRGTTNAAAPELDHIVPLSIGGAHSYANTQCLCRKCNQAKGATVAGQLPLL